MAQPGAQPKFKVLKVLGKGSYGTVYKVQRLADGVVYAMKETDLGRMGPKEKADAVNEIRVLGSMSHPNVVRHHETFLAGNKLCIVMEYAPAGDLASFIKAAAGSKLPLPEATIWQIFLQLCQGMQAIHETCVIHRDIKPANIFMSPNNVVKVGDLGVAKALTKAHYAQTTIGTPVFMAPEVWRGLRYGYSSDLWSLGGVLYEMMTYRLPFEARSLNELKNKIIMGTFAPLKPGAPYSSSLVAVCHALLNKDPRKRPTCAAILNSSEAAPWLNTIPDEVRMPLPPLDAVPSLAPPMAAVMGGGGGNPQLLPTIHVPRDIRLLPNHLPKPSYDSSNSPAAYAQGSSRSSSNISPNGYPAGAGAMAGMRPPRPRSGGGGAAGGGFMRPAASPSTRHQEAGAAGGALGMPSPRMPSPRMPSPRMAGGMGPGMGVGAIPERRAYDPSARLAAGAGGGILGMRAAAAAAAGAGADRARVNVNNPYGISPSVLGRVPSGGLGGGAAAGGARAAAAPPRTPPGGFKPPSQGMVYKQPTAAGRLAAGRVPSAGSRAAGAAAGMPVGARAVAAAGGQAAAMPGGWMDGRAGAGAMGAAAGARPAVRRGFY